MIKREPLSREFQLNAGHGPLATLSALLTLLSTLLLFAAPARAEVTPRHGVCCLCVLDDVDQEGTMGSKRECDKWLSQQRHCPQKLAFSKSFVLDFDRKDANISCEKISIYGAFHGSSSSARIPFDISARAARLFRATEVCYDGTTCLAFNNIKDVEACAANLADTKACKFRISANQNLGVVSGCSWFRPTEVSQTASRLTATYDGVRLMLEYPACSSPGDKCGWLSPLGDPSAKTDPNEKFCFDGSAITTQSCCIKPGTTKINALSGRWAKPAQKCE